MATRFADHLLEGDHASRPAFGDVPQGTLYSCSDHDLIYQSDGSSAWSTWATVGGGASVPDLTGGRATRTAGDVTKTGDTNFSDVTGMSVTITTGARRCIVGATVSGYVNNAAGTAAVDLDIDGSRVGATSFGSMLNLQHSTASESMDYSFTYLTDVLSAASHTFKLQMKVNNAAHTFTINANDPPCVLWVAEQLIDS